MKSDNLLRLKHGLPWYAMLRWGVNVSLAACIGLSLWALSANFRAKPAATQGPAMTATAQPHSDMNHAAASRLFGVPAPQAPAQQASVEASDITLVGLMAADTPGNSLAIVEMRGEEKVLAVGGTLPDGETLESITPEGVLLRGSRGERELTLPLRGAPADAVFATLPISMTGESGAEMAVATPPVSTAPVVPMAQQLVSLRQEALRALAERVRDASRDGQRSPPR